MCRTSPARHLGTSSPSSTFIHASPVLAALAPCLVRAAPPLHAAPTRPATGDELIVAATTDVHGRLRGWDYYANAPDTLRAGARSDDRGLAARRDPGRVVLVDAGDLLQGNPLRFRRGACLAARP